MVNEQTNSRQPGVIQSFVALSNRAKAVWLATVFCAGALGATGMFVGKAVDMVRWPALVDSRLDVLDETATEIPPIKAEILVIRGHLEKGRDERTAIIEKVEQLESGQYRITLRLERLDERTGRSR
jgi:hypothetical protein